MITLEALRRYDRSIRALIHAERDPTDAFAFFVIVQRDSGAYAFHVFDTVTSFPKQTQLCKTLENAQTHLQTAKTN
jgi:hypothetical protein